MIQHLHSLICGRSILDKNTGLASYIDILEGISFKNVKNLKLPNFTLISKYWVKDGISDGHVLEIDISIKKTGSASKSKTLQKMSFPIETKGENVLVQLDIQNFIIEEPGLWEFEVKWKLKESTRWAKGSVIPFKVDLEP